MTLATIGKLHTDELADIIEQGVGVGEVHGDLFIICNSGYPVSGLFRTRAGWKHNSSDATFADFDAAAQNFYDLSLTEIKSRAHRAEAA